MNISQACKFLDTQIPDKTKGLPDEIFYFISRITPMVNVDLLVKDKKGRTLLAWRDDEYCGKGWHIPGSIIRFKETMEHRIIETARKELGTININFNIKPVFFHEIILPHLDNRAHFISFLYECSLKDEYFIDNKSLKLYDAGYLEWHDRCPDNLIPMQEPYREFINNTK